MKLLKIAMVALMLVSPIASANSLMLGGWSKHFVEKGANEDHKLIAAEYKNVVVGIFVNSFNNRSYLLGYDNYYDTDYLKLGLITGVVKGYTSDNGAFKHLVIGHDYAPMVIPYLQVNTPYIQPKVGLLGRSIFITFNIDFKANMAKLTLKQYYSLFNKKGPVLTPSERKRQQSINKHLNRKAYVAGVYVSLEDIPE